MAVSLLRERPTGVRVPIVASSLFEGMPPSRHDVARTSIETTRLGFSEVDRLRDRSGRLQFDWSAKMSEPARAVPPGFMTTIHAYTGDQPTLDTMHKDLYRARAAAMSMIPTSTGAAKAVGLVLPELKGRLDGVSIRVPTPNVSVIDFKFVAKKATSVEEVNEAMQAASEQQLKGILGYTEAPNVSSDFNHDPHSSIFHMDQTKVMDGTLVRVMSWYDNEWGFSNRMDDPAVAMGKLI